MLRTASSLPLAGRDRWAPAPPVSRRNRQPATGPPGSYPDRTHTGRRRRAYEQNDPLLRHSVTSRSAGRTRSPHWASTQRARIASASTCTGHCTVTTSPRHKIRFRTTLPGRRQPDRDISALDIPRLWWTQVAGSGPSLIWHCPRNANQLAPPLAPQPVRIFSNLVSELEPPTESNRRPSPYHRQPGSPCNGHSGLERPRRWLRRAVASHDKHSLAGFCPPICPHRDLQTLTAVATRTVGTSSYHRAMMGAWPYGSCRSPSPLRWRRPSRPLLPKRASRCRPGSPKPPPKKPAPPPSTRRAGPLPANWWPSTRPGTARSPKPPGSAPEHQISRVLKARDILPDDERTGRAAGVACAASGTADVVDAIVVATAD